MIARWIVLLCLAIGVGMGTAAAQAPGESPLRKGDRVRIRTPWSPSTIEGTLVAADAAGLSVQTKGRDAGRRSFSLSEIAGLEVSRGKKRNVLWGALIGTAAGVFVDLAATTGDQSPCDYGACVVLPAMGAAAGALVGLAVKTERWESVPTDRLAVRVTGVPGRGLALAVRWSF